MFKFRKKKTQPDLDVIVIGEAHTNESHIDKECNLIEEYLPEYVLYEGKDNYTPEKSKNLLKFFENTTLNEIANEVHADLKTIGLGKKQIKKNERNSIVDMFSGGKKPKLYRTLINTPLYDLAPSVLHNLIETLDSEEVADSKNMNLNAAKQYITRVILEHICFKTDHMFTSERSKLYATIAKNGAQLVGCDIDKSDLSVAEIHKLCGEREQTMGSCAVEYAGKRKTNKPIIMIVGQHHTEDDSGIIPILEESELKYKIIKPKVRATRKDQFYHLTLEKSL
jgi:hypothetical protein